MLNSRYVSLKFENVKMSQPKAEVSMKESWLVSAKDSASSVWTSLEWRKFLKFIYSEKATRFCEISILLLTVCTVVKSKLEISQKFVAFSEYMNFTIVNKFLKNACTLLIFSKVDKISISTKETFRKGVRRYLIIIQDFRWTV